MCVGVTKDYKLNQYRFPTYQPFRFFSKKQMYRLFLSPHSLSVTTVTLGSRLFFIRLQINLPQMGKIQGRPELPHNSPWNFVSHTDWETLGCAHSEPLIFNNDNLMLFNN